MAYYRKRAKGWQAQIEKAGVRVSDTFRTKAEAVAWATAKEVEIAAGERDEAPRKYVSDALKKYAEEESPKRKGLRIELIRLTAFQRDLPFRNKLISEVTQTDIAKWRDARVDEISAATVGREWNLLHSVFQVARKEWRWLSESPFIDVKRPSAAKPRFRRVWDKERDAICKALRYAEDQPVSGVSPQVAVAFLLGIETAMRAGELLGLAWARVDADKRVATLLDSKNGDRRDVPLSSRAVQLIEKLRGLDKVHVFTITPRALDVAFRKAREKAAKDLPSVSSLHFHDTRHEACTRLAKKLNVLELGRVIGHRDPKSLMIYFNATAEEIASKLD